jgi:hypothetical protein
VSVAAVVQASASADRGDGGAAYMSGSPPPPTLVLYTKADCPLCAGLEVRKGKEELATLELVFFVLEKWPRFNLPLNLSSQKYAPPSTRPPSSPPP